MLRCSQYTCFVHHSVVLPPCPGMLHFRGSADFRESHFLKISKSADDLFLRGSLIWPQNRETAWASVSRGSRNREPILGACAHAELMFRFLSARLPPSSAKSSISDQYQEYSGRFRGNVTAIQFCREVFLGRIGWGLENKR